MALLTSCWLIDLAVLALSALVGGYIYFNAKFQYWKKRGVSTPFEPSMPFGHFKGVQTKKNLALLVSEIYTKIPKNEKFIGAYLFGMPVLIIKDLDIAKQILIKDFNHFQDRGFEVDVKKEPLSGHLFLMKGQEWRNLRIKLTPTFTSGKMKMMFNTLIDVGKNLIDVFNREISNTETEVKDILSRYTSDVIASCAFGIEINSLKNPENEFRKLGDEITHPSLKTRIYNIVTLISPLIAKYLPLTSVPQHIADFFYGVVKDTMTYREKNNTRRNDFLQLLLELKNQGYVKDADNKDEERPDASQKFTIDQAAAQVFLFFVAGFETSSATMQFALYELAQNPELQTSLQEEIDRVKVKHGSLLTYDGIQEMDLLDRVVSETLRKYSVAIIIIRESNSNYQIPGTDVTLEKGTKVWFPVYGYQMDPEHFPEPDKFDPGRFRAEEIEKRHNYCYLPFGEGPRSCIGNRFALMQTKVGLATILSNFTVSPSKRTPIPMVFDPKADLLASKEPLYLKVTKRNV